MANTKRPSPSSAEEADLGPPEKKFKAASGHESPTGYSDSVRRKLQATNRTGQACDRCKERKMRCDPNPLGCGPCKQKNLPCVTTDRISGRPSERGHTERLEGEINALRIQLNAYISKYGPMDGANPLPKQPYEASPPFGVNNDYSGDTSQSQKLGLLNEFTNGLGARHGEAGPYSGPIRGTKVEVMGLQCDVADFDCPGMHEPKDSIPDVRYQFNNSRTSFLNTIMGRVAVPVPDLPDKDTAFTYAKYYISVVAPYTPLLHGPSFLRLVGRMYEPTFRPTVAESVSFFVVMAIISYQMAVRNPSHARNDSEKSNRYYHYCLSQLGELLKDTQLPSLQAMAMILIHARNLPKPGYSWGLSKLVLTRVVELNYHRSASKLDVTHFQQFNPLEVELRKRIFWVVYEKVVMSGLKLGRPMPMDMSDLDIEFPEAILDEEISEQGILGNRSGRCTFWIGLQVIRQVPLWVDLYNNIIKVRKPASEYTQHLEILDTRIIEWKAQSDADFAKETMDGNLQVASSFAQTWFAEYRLLLHHPHLCTSKDPQVLESNLEICHDASLSLLQIIQALFEKFRGADFTWHSTVVYVLAAGMSIEYYQQRQQQLTPEIFKNMQQELSDWLKVMKGAGAVLGSGDQLLKFFKPLVETCLRDSQNVLIASTALQNGHQESIQQSRPNLTPAQSVPAYQPLYGDSGTNQMFPTNSRRSSMAFPLDNSTMSQPSQKSIPSFITQYDYAQEAQRRTSTSTATNTAHDIVSSYPSSTSPQYAQLSSLSSSTNLPTASPVQTSKSTLMYPAVNMPQSLPPPPTYSNNLSSSTIKQEHQQQQHHPANTLLSLSQAGLPAGAAGLNMMEDTLHLGGSTTNGFNLGSTATGTGGMWPNTIFQNGT